MGKEDSITTTTPVNTVVEQAIPPGAAVRDFQDGCTDTGPIA